MTLLRFLASPVRLRGAHSAVRRLLAAMLVAVAPTAIIASCSSGGSLVDPGPGPYFGQVKSIIATNCVSCHSSSGPWTGRPTKFDSDADILLDAAAIKAAVADPVSVTNGRMPQGGRLSDHDIAVIVRWFQAGGRSSD
jgi:uncharacterized membrane protein